MTRDRTTSLVAGTLFLLLFAAMGMLLGAFHLVITSKLGIFGKDTKSPELAQVEAYIIAERPGLPIDMWDKELWSGLSQADRRSIAAGYWIATYALSEAGKGGLAPSEIAGYCESISSSYSGDSLEAYVSDKLRAFKRMTVVKAFLSAGWVSGGGL